MKSLFSRAVGGALWLAGCGWAGAQQGTLAPVVVTGNPLGAADQAAPVETLSGTGLVLRAQGSLGETLSGLAGVSSTYFGPSASRPVIRGFDGDRVRVLSNSGSLGDVSSLSYDHAVAADPIVVERIEVLRGPAALLYGGTAIGGAVNLIDNRIPREPPEAPRGKAAAGIASGSDERHAALSVDTGTRRAALHADLFRRRNADVRVPLDLPCTSGATAGTARRICNSSAHAEGGALGGSAFFDRGYAGLAASTFASDYGSVAEGEVTIRLRSRRYAFESELRDLHGWFSGLKLQASQGDYRHTEFDAGVAGTEFLQLGTDLRLEARHRPWGRLEGVWGIHADAARFAAIGDEAFAPFSRTRQWAVFALEELRTGWGSLNFGARAERVEVRSLGHPQVGRFVPASRSFAPRSVSAGALWKAAAEWQATAYLSHSERAPRDYELFADGPHVATGAYEVGHAGLGPEISRAIDVGAKWRRGANRFQFNAWRAQMRDYVVLTRTGLLRDTEGNGAGTGVADCGDGTSLESGCAAEVMPEFAYSAVRASFTGAEASGRLRLLDGVGTVDLELRADIVRARNAGTGEPLPRIAPARVAAELQWQRGPWGARLGAEHHARQQRVPAGDRPTAGYTLVNAALTYRIERGRLDALAFARVQNAADRLAYSASSLLTQSVPGRVPLPGRSVRVGVQAAF